MKIRVELGDVDGTYLLTIPGDILIQGDDDCKALAYKLGWDGNGSYRDYLDDFAGNEFDDPGYFS